MGRTNKGRKVADRNSHVDAPDDPYNNQTLQRTRKFDEYPHYTRTDTINSTLTYEGRTYDNSAETSDAKWQVKRIIKLGTEVIEEYVSDGEYNQIWDDRETLFPVPPFSNTKSLSFDGVDEYVDFGDNFDFGPAEAFTIAGWVKANNLSAQRTIFAKTTPDANVFGYSFQHNSSGKLYVQWRASGTLRAFTFNTTLSAATWYHLTFAYGGGSNINSLTVYINAVAENIPSSGSLNDWGHASPFRLGQRGSTHHFSGKMNQFGIWDKELSQSEVTELYNSGSPADLTAHSAVGNLISRYPLNSEANFPTEVDQEGSVDGTLTNMESEDYEEDVP